VHDRTETAANGPTEPQCDCGYACRGATLDDRVQDALRHAREAHGIEVSREQVLATDRTGV
jgi:hypothetical protein